jgi:signal transduction histidine kinase
VRITVSNDSRRFRLTVADNGVGFDPEQAREGHGLKNMLWRASAMKGRLDLQSRAGQGTTITFEAAFHQMRDQI